MIAIVSYIENFQDLKKYSWGGALTTIRKVEKEGKEQELMDLLEEWLNSIDDGGLTTLKEINETLWFKREKIYELLNIQ